MKTLFEGKKLYALIIVFFFIITFFIVFNIIHNHYKYVVKNTIAENTLKARFFSLLIFEHQKATIGILESYAQRSSFINVVKKKDFNNAISHLKSLSKHYNEIDILFLTDQYGTVWANYPVDKTGFGKNLAYRDWYKGVSKKWRPYISTVFRLIVLEKDLAVAVSVPVFDRNGKVIGILGSTQRAPFLATFINGNITNPEKSITLLDQKGNIIFSNSILYQENITKYPDARVLEKAVAGVFINMDIADAKDKGSISYVSITPVKGIGWSVIVGQEKDTILKSLYGYFIRSAVTGFTIFLFLAVSLLYFRREYKYRKTKELLQAEEKYRNIFNDAILGIYQTTPEGRFLSANPALARLCGYDTPEELTNCVTDLATQIYVNPEDRETFKGILSREGVVEKFETRLCKKSGEIIWVSINAHIIKDGQGNITHYEGTIEDITERKRAEEALRENEDNFRRSLDDSPLGVRIVTIEGETIYANQAILDIYGYDSVEELRTTPVKNRYTPQSYAEFQIRMKKRRQGKYDPSEYGINIVKKNGEVRYLLVFRKEILWNGERQFQTIYQDITERKRAEEALRENEERLRTIVEASLDAIIAVNAEGQLVLFNSAAQELFQYSEEEALNQPANILLREEIGKIHQERLKRFLNTGVGQCGHIGRRTEKLFRRKDGSLFEAEVSMSGGRLDGLRLVVLAIHDITSRKQTEKALQESEIKYRNIFNDAILGIYQTTPEGRILNANPALVKMYGYDTSEELINDVTATQMYVNPEDREIFKRILSKEGAVEKFEVPFRKTPTHESGEIFWVSINAHIVKDGQGNITHYEGTIEDITERKRVEEALRKNQEQLRDAHRLAHIGIWNWIADTDTVTWTEELYRIVGLDPMITAPTYAEHPNIYTPESWDRLKVAVEKTLETGAPHQLELELIRPDGTTRWVNTFGGATYDNHGRITGLRGTVQDITERKLVEKMLAKSRALLIEAQGMAHIGHWELDTSTMTTTWSEEIFHIFSLDPEEGEPSFEAHQKVIHTDDWGILNNAMTTTIVEGIPFDIVFRILRPDKTIRWMHAIGYPKKDSEGRIVSVFGTAQDITDMRLIEEALREREEHYRILTEKNIAGIYLIQDGLFRYVNPTFCSIYGYTGNELVDKLSPLDLVVEEEREFANDRIQQRLSGEKESDQFSMRIRRKDGEIRLLEMFSSYALYAGKPAVLGTCIDMTEARRANEAIKRSQKELRALTAYLQNIREEERTQIAREIHDELGQSLTGIKIDISWLKKKLSNIVEPADPIQAKIDSLLTLTESTIAVTRELSLSLRPGILDDLGLVVAINWQLKRFQEKAGIICMLQTDVAEITIPTDYATALFRISQECLTNISRYANATKVKIALTKEGENLVLEIEDNGKGITTEQIRNPLSLGILGMRERIKNLKGKFHISGAPGKGTKVRVELPMK
ncbi:MAG: PAS domain S-box protein [Syntrophorhabdaceae bacterium]|nr:PAS domain S-box protein [Syntrophorhabdaceae bacterium]MDD5244938.1 PAS domain S-box protein [Syntrophorhabdaceae bacterium]